MDGVGLTYPKATHFYSNGSKINILYHAHVYPYFFPRHRHRIATNRYLICYFAKVTLLNGSPDPYFSWEKPIARLADLKTIVNQRLVLSIFHVPSKQTLSVLWHKNCNIYFINIKDNPQICPGRTDERKEVRINGMVPFKPFGELSLFRGEMDRLWDRFLRERPMVRTFSEEWAPSVDISETGDNLIVKAELPGLEAKDVNVSLSGDLLTIKGREEKRDRGKG